MSRRDALPELLDKLRAGGDLAVVRAGMPLVAQALIQLEATQALTLGALGGRHQPAGEPGGVASAP